MKKVSKSEKETKQIAKIFLNRILSGKKKSKNALVVGLSGNLGAGKTAFVQAAAKHLGVKNKVVSPTFVIVKKYVLKGKKHRHLFHLDAYRLKNERELKELGWREILENPENLVFIEWPENVRKALPQKTHRVRIAHGPDGQRHFHGV